MWAVSEAGYRGVSKSPGVFVQGAAAATAINTHVIPQICYEVTGPYFIFSWCYGHYQVDFTKVQRC